MYSYKKSKNERQPAAIYRLSSPCIQSRPTTVALSALINKQRASCMAVQARVSHRAARSADQSITGGKLGGALLRENNIS